ncbi:DNA binding domain, excisionase family [uncultured Dysgonomonas sp.]|uniref:DNA binding domain, excisionase family n=1 Tax=uncultured Dysgonomonas sp. TaxID=206096 RepID=A0A212JWE9_9BACT|nr:helix-turn-helix domain-containing protein [uncultured Dysgonomonas sp.]SBW03796.1 DNA binding domain, excisionase family [uncultured Dysgonomonas sp.]
MNNTETVTFETMPKALSYLIGKVEALESRLQPYIESQPEPTAQWFNIDGLMEYLPDHPAKATIYGWVSNKQIPYHKGGKKLRFLKTEIDKWLETGKRQSQSELREKASTYCDSKNIGG